MARHSRRRRRKRQDELDDAQPERTRVIVDQRVVGAARQFGAKREDFKEGGFSCNRCEWRTKKRGFSGRQALRAHLKRHVRERRAILRPLMAQAFVVLCAVAIHLFAGEIPIDLDSVHQDQYPPASVARIKLAAQIAAIAVPCALIAVHWTAALKFTRSGRASTSRLTSTILRVNVIALLSAAAVSGGVLGVSVWPGWFAGFIALALSNLYLAPSVSRIRLDMARREFQPAGYAPLFMTGSAEVDEKLASFRSRIKSAIYRGELDPDIAGARRQRLLVSLGLAHVRPRPKPNIQRRSPQKKSVRRRR